MAPASKPQPGEKVPSKRNSHPLLITLVANILGWLLAHAWYAFGVEGGLSAMVAPFLPKGAASVYALPFFFGASLYFLICTWAQINVTSARARFNVFWPTMYADKSNMDHIKFNCVQRAHQFLLEGLPIFLYNLMVASYFFPVSAALLALIFNISKVVGTLEYYSGAEKRKWGSVGYPWLFLLYGLHWIVLSKVLGCPMYN